MSRPQGAHNALKAPGEGDARALADLLESRELLKKRQRSKKITSRDLAIISAELRKVNASIAIVQGASSKGGLAEEELESRAAQVREQFSKLVETARREQLKLAAAG